MYHVGVLGALDENIVRCIKKHGALAENGYMVTCCDRAKRLIGDYDFVVVSPIYAKSREKVEGVVSHSKILLVPGKSATRISGIISSGCIVAYGLSAKDTITLSSIGDSRGVIAVQREMANIHGIILERQEFPVKYEAGMTPETVITIVGTLLILGVSTEIIGEMKFTISKNN